MPVDLLQQTVVHHIRHTEADAVAVAVTGQIANVDAVNAWRVRPRIVLAVDPSIDHLGIHSGPTDVLSDLVHDQNVELRNRDLAHPALDQGEQLFFPGLHLLDRYGGQLRGVVIGIFEDGQASKNLAGCEHLPPDCADYMFQAELVGVGVVTLRAGKLAEANRHHFEQSAFDLAGEIGVPLDTAYQHHAIRFEGVAIHECLDAVARRAEGDDVESADHRTAHGRLVDAIVGEHVRLALRARCPVATHGRENEGMAALRFPELDHRSDDRGDIRDAPASDSDRDARSGFDPRGESGSGQLAPDLAGNIWDCAARKILTHRE